MILRVDGFTSAKVKTLTPVAQKYKVQILTPEVSSRDVMIRVAALLVVTCFTSTKIAILTPAEPRVLGEFTRRDSPCGRRRVAGRARGGGGGGRGERYRSGRR